MKLIIGGAYQGKHEYARKHYGDMEMVDGFHALVLELVTSGADAAAYVKEHAEDYADKVIICDDIFCGVVPVDPLMRQWREALGHTLAFIAGQSDEVVRVFCGLGTRLK